MCFVSNIGSRNDTTWFFSLTDGSIYVRCGCFSGSIEDFEAAVNQEHGADMYGGEYQAAIAFAKARHERHLKEGE